MQLWKQELAQSSTFKSETRESQCCISAWVKGMRTKGADDISPNLSAKVWVPGALMFKGTRRWMLQLKRGNLPFLHLFVLISALSGLDVPTVLVSVLFFTQSALGQVT